MKKTLIIIFFQIIIQITCQTKQDSIDINVAISNISDRSYITFSQGVGNKKVSNNEKTKLDPLIFEAQIAPNFIVNFKKDSKFGMAITPKVILRMYNEESLPVKTPSYLPSITIYHTLEFMNKIFDRSNFLKSLIGENSQHFVTYKLSHYSNGQKGNYFIDNTNEINFENGNFSTNFFELGYNWFFISDKKNKSSHIGRISFEKHFDIDREEKMFETFYYHKISIQNFTNYNEKFKSGIQCSVMTGKGNYKTNFSLDTFFLYNPFKNNSDFSFVLRYYNGKDYYNLHNVEKISALTIGIVAEPRMNKIFKLK